MSVPPTRILEWFLFPPGVVVLLLLLALYLLNDPWERDSIRRATSLLWLSLFLVYGFSLNVTADALTRFLEQSDLHPPLSRQDIQDAQAEAIIILGHGRDQQAPEYDGYDTLNLVGLARARYGAKLHRESGLPILTSGGTPLQGEISEAEIMKQILEEEFKVPVRWVEKQSQNTYENALFSSMMLEKSGIGRAFVVTDARHILRARQMFEHVGLIKIIAAPTLFSQPADQTRWLDWIPRSEAFRRTSIALHELVGMVWYSLRYGAL